MNLPETWVQTTIRAVVEDIQPGFAQKPGEENDGTTPQIRTHNITPNGKISLAGIKHITASRKELIRYSLTIGDVIFNNTNSEEWVGKTAVFDQEGEFVFSNHMTRLRVRKDLILPEYLAGYLQLLWSIGYAKTRAKRWVSQAGIESDILASFKILLPTLPEQQRIVDVLKQADVVEKMRYEFDELLGRTKRQLFIEMFGDPNPKFNSRWPIVNLGQFVNVATGGTPSRGQADSYGSAHAWVKSTDLKDTVIDTTEERLSELGIQRSNAKLYPKHTIMLAMYGQGQTRGRTGKLLIEASCNQACSALLPSDELQPDYLWIWLQLSYDSVRALGRGGQQENLNLDIVRSIQIPKPPITLQQEFSRRLAYLIDVFEKSRSSRERFSSMHEVLQIEVFKGDATATWRKLNSHQITKQAQLRDELLRKHGAKVSVVQHAVKVNFPIQTKPFVRPTRHWLLAELSEFQRQVLTVFTQYCQQSGKPLLVDDPEIFSSFYDDSIVTDHLGVFGSSLGNRIRRTLSQLAALGVIAKITLPKQDLESGELKYVKAFRTLRPEEFTRMDDVRTLYKATSSSVDQQSYYFEVQLDFETSERTGASGMFQVISLEDGDGEDFSHLVIDQGKQYSLLEELKEDIASELKVNTQQINLEVV